MILSLQDKSLKKEESLEKIKKWSKKMNLFQARVETTFAQTQLI